MSKRTSHPAVRWCLLSTAGIGILILIIWFPVGIPKDSSERMFLSPRFGSVKRFGFGSKHSQSWPRRRGASYRPRFVDLKSDGHDFRAYLLDLSSIEDPEEAVSTFMTATVDIASGEQPATAAMVAKATDVVEVRFHLGTWSWRFPWGWDTNYMLIVYSDNETTVDVRVSYGR